MSWKKAMLAGNCIRSFQCEKPIIKHELNFPSLEFEGFPSALCILSPLTKAHQ